MNRQIKFIDLGTMDYKEAWDFQQNLFNEIVEIKKENRKNNTNLKTPNYFLFVEHQGWHRFGFQDGSKMKAHSRTFDK